MSKSLVVDMDSHVMEPPDLWQNYLEPRYRDRAIRIERDADGLETIMIDDDVLLKGRLAALGGASHAPTQRVAARRRHVAGVKHGKVSRVSWGRIPYVC